MHRIARVALLVLVWLAAASAEAGPYAYAWANQPVADFYFPAQANASNPANGVVTITRNDVGEYRVRFGGLERIGVGGGNVQVTANGGTADRCKVVEWFGDEVDVRCFDSFGIAVDWQFFVLVTRASEETANLAYAWADLPAAASYTANPTYVHNPGGGDVTVERSGVGLYTVTFGGFGPIGLDGGNVIATAQGAGSEHCKIDEWGADAAYVRCLDTNGAAADARFTVLYTKRIGPTPDLFYVWANGASAEAPYEPDTEYSYDPSGDPLSAVRDGVGVYRVFFPGLDELSVEGDGTMQVTAYGSDADTCRAYGTTGEALNVRCYDAAGAPADSRFSALLVAPETDALGAALAAITALGLRVRRVRARRLALLATLGALAPLPATAAAPQAYVWAGEPELALYRPSPAYASNPSGGQITITRTGAGSYSVHFVGLNGVGDDGGNVQATAYGSGGGHCKVEQWIGELVGVRCYDAAGGLSDSSFTLLYTRAEEDSTGVAYAWANQASEASYFANFNYAFNPGGGVVEVERANAGIYTVRFPGLDVLGLDGGNVQVTAYGAGASYCKVQSWGGDSAGVRCFDAAGVAADSQFTVLLTKPEVATPDLFYVWANSAAAPAPYEPDAEYAYDASDGAIEVERTGTGAYSVTFPGLDELTVGGGGQVQVTAYGASNRRCAVEGWEGEVVAIGCTEPDGDQVDTNFSALVVAPEAGAFGMALAAIGALGLRRRRASRR